MNEKKTKAGLTSTKNRRKKYFQREVYNENYSEG
jgi:hypothetical protein